MCESQVDRAVHNVDRIISQLMPVTEEEDDDNDCNGGGGGWNDDDGVPPQVWPEGVSGLKG